MHQPPPEDSAPSEGTDSPKPADAPTPVPTTPAKGRRRPAWLARLLRLKAEEWKTLLKLFQQDILDFSDPQAASEFV